MDWFGGFLAKYPELAVFLAIAFGYKPGPDEMPTTAMNTFRPMEFMNQRVGEYPRARDRKMAISG
jgi:hypothetical protein